MDRKQWFLNRIGKRVFPTIICDCQACKSYYDSGFIIDNEFEAIALYDLERDFQAKYFDTKEERTIYETENYWKIREEFKKRCSVDSKLASGKTSLINCSVVINKLKQASEAFNQKSKSILNSNDAIKKQKHMKITDETIIKDLIPEGYELELNPKIGDSSKISTHSFYIRKKEVKDFKWYVDKYFEVKQFVFQSGIHKMTECKKHEDYVNILNESYENCSFESRIGLLKFICDDLKLPIDIYLNPNTIDAMVFGVEIRKVKAICPAEFLNSIFK